MRKNIALLALSSLLFSACAAEVDGSREHLGAGAPAGKADGADEAWQTTKLLAVANGLGVGDPHWYMEDIAKFEMGFSDEEWDALSFLQEPITSRAALEALVGSRATLAIDAYAQQMVGLEEYWGWLSEIATGDEHATTGVRVWGKLSGYSDMYLAAAPGDQIALRLVQFCGPSWNPRIDLWGGSVSHSVNPAGSADVEIPYGAFVDDQATTGVSLDVDQLNLSIENRDANEGNFLLEIQCVSGPCSQKPSTLDRWAFLFDAASMRAQSCTPIPPPPPAENDDATCSDGIDNDGNGYLDCVDYSCRYNPLVTVCAVAPEDDDASCSDGVDNDLDGYVDCADHDCSRNSAVTICAPPVEDEANDARCADGVDNDLDGDVDCADSDCSQNANVSVCAPPPPPATLLETIYAERAAKMNVLSYYEARRFLFSVLDNEQGQVTGVYTDEPVYTSGIPNASVMNTEHTWPNSWVLSADSGYYSDLHHLFPAKSWINQERGARPFCEVAIVQGSHPAGSRWGIGVDGVDCFEPRDAHKGNAARAMFYISAAYALPMDDGMEAILRGWHRQDPPDLHEGARNAAITTAQGYGNVFVSSPNTVAQIADF